MSYYLDIIKLKQTEGYKKFLNSLGNGYYANLLKVKYNSFPDHDGRPGQVGGSLPRGASGVESKETKKDFYKKLPKELQDKYKGYSKEIQETVGYCLLGNPVCEMTGKEFSKSTVKLSQQVEMYFKKKYQGKVRHKELGEVSLDMHGIKDDIAHGTGRLKSAAFYAVPKVIQEGLIYDRQKNWKGRGYDTFRLAAPITIDKGRYVVEVIIKKSKNRQGLYIHEVGISEELDKLFWTPL